MEKNNQKRELKVVLSSELYDELKYTFRPAQLENIIYKPEMLSETKWQCCCGSECELDVCPICGMDKHTVFSKIHANYLARHRKARLANKKKASLDKQALMASQMLNKKQPKEKNSKKTGSLIGILFLCIAIIICFLIVYNSGSDNDQNKDTGANTTVNTNKPDGTKAPDSTTDAPDSSDNPEDTTAPEDTTEVIPPAPAEPTKVPTTVTTDVIATIGEGKWYLGATGNTTLGGLVYTDGEYDYLAKDGITVLNRDGEELYKLTENKARSITGSGNYIFYIDEENKVHKIDITSKKDTAFELKANTICAFHDELFYTPFEDKGLYAADFYGNTVKIFTLQQVYALTNCADKIYFSTESSLCVVTSKDSNVLSICNDGAKATSILEIVDCIFYTTQNGQLKFYNPKLSQMPGFESPGQNVKFTYVAAYNNRVYVRTQNYYTGAVDWICTVWTPGTQMFHPIFFGSTGINTDALYVTGSAIYDGNLNRRTVS